MKRIWLYPRTWGVGFLGPAATIKGGVALLGVGLIDAIGMGLYLAGSAIYFVLVVGLSSTQVGVGLSIAGLLGMVAQPILGSLADQYGPRRILILLYLWRALSLAALSVTGSFLVFAVVAAMIGVSQQSLPPVYQALVERIAGSQARVAIMARTRVVYNVGFSLGGVLATVAIGYGTRLAFASIVLGNALCCALAALFLSRLGVRDQQTRDATNSAKKTRLRSLRDFPYLSVAAVNGILGLHSSLLAVGVPLWVTLHTDAPRALVGALLVVNTIFAVLMQIRAARGSDTIDGSITALRRCAYALVGCCCIFALSRTWHVTAAVVAFMILGVIILTIAEVLQAAGGWGLSYALAPAEGRAEHLSTFNLGIGAQLALGPTIVTVGVIDHGTAGWLALAGAFAVTAAIISPLATAAARRPALAGTAAGS
ncbi:MAG TPA: MFS transporter [Streptosporangiaceae bacterium]|nr:MFS transporter [Streptosporangiaceae bacterium]